jgi:serine/threonine-protein kinase
VKKSDRGEAAKGLSRPQFLLPTGEVFVLQLFLRRGCTDMVKLGAIIDGRYRIDEFLGQGTMGAVFRARDRQLGQDVAIKLLPRQSGRSNAAERFKQEALALAQIRHDNVVRFYASGQDDEFHYITMEFISGRSLDSIVDDHAARGGTLPVDVAVEIVRRLGAGLMALHEKQLLHRDIKPANVVVEGSSGRPVLVDFGLARRLSPSSPRVSFIAGTPGYMSPEQARDVFGLSARSDVYSLACTAFELLSGRPLFDSEDAITIFLAHAEKPPPSLSAVRPELASFDPVFERALAKTPADRYGSCAEFVAAFEAAAQAARDAVLGPRAPSVRVLVLQRGHEQRRDVLRMIESTLRAAGDEVAVTCVESERDFLRTLENQRADIVMIDDDDVAGAFEPIIEGVRAAPCGRTSEVGILSDKSPSSAELERLRVRTIPKPVNLQVLRSVVTKMGVRIAERRFAASMGADR